MGLMRDWIVERVRGRLIRHSNADALHTPLKIVVVGSAFGLEVREALVQLSTSEREAIAVTLLDLDPAAIDFARQQLAPWLPPERLSTGAVNLFRLPERPQLAGPLADADLLLCPGIFDYLADAAAVAMLRLFWRRLAPGGMLSVMQFAPHNPSRALMEWIGNWQLIYRDESQLRQIVAAAGIPPAAARFAAEPLGVDLFVTAIKQ
jgi:SAM-dependent methyltransferase